MGKVEIMSEAMIVSLSVFSIVSI